MNTRRSAILIGLFLALCTLTVGCQQQGSGDDGQAQAAQSPVVPPAPAPPGTVTPPVAAPSTPPAVPFQLVPPAPPPPDFVPPLVNPNGPPPVAPVTPGPPGAPLVATLGDVQLSGLYVQVRALYFGTSMSLEYTHYYFFPSGKLFFGTPPGGTVGAVPRDEDFTAMQQLAPDRCGTYQIRGDRITIDLPGKPTKSMSFSFEKPGDPNTVKLDTLGAVKVGRFQDPQRLSAVYEAGATAKTEASATRGPLESFVASSTTLNFRPDGTFTRDRQGLVDATGREVGISGSSTQNSGGTYQLSGNTLTLIESGGQTRSATVYPYPDEQEFPPNRMAIDGTWYKLLNGTN